MLSSNRKLTFWASFSVAMLLLAFAMVLFYAPLEQTMGWVQKVFYFHVGAGWLGMLAFAVAMVVSIVYLRKGDLKMDAIAASAAEIGLLFSIITTLSGMIWARPSWNTWWTWDPRLTTMVIMAFTYLAYFLLRNGMDNPIKRARFGSIYLIVGFITVPITFFSARLLRSIHPTVFSSNGGEKMAMTAPMYQTMGFSIFAFTILFVFLLILRSQLRMEEQKLKEAEALENEIEFGEVNNG